MIFVLLTAASGSALLIEDISRKLDVTNKHLEYLSKVIYSIYLFVHRLSDYADLVFALSITILLCVWYYRYLEKFTRF